MLIFSNICRSCVGEAALARAALARAALAELPWREFATRAKQPLEKKYELQTHAENLSGAGL